MSGFEKNLGLEIENTGDKKPDLGDVKNIKDSILNIIDIRKKEEISDVLDELGIKEEKQENIINELLKFKNIEYKEVLEEIKNTAFSIEDINFIINTKKEKQEVIEEKQDKTILVSELEQVKNGDLKQENKKLTENQELKTENEEVETENKEVKTENEELETNKEKVDKYKKLIDFLKNQNLDHSKGYWPIIDSILSKDVKNLEISDIEKELNSLKSNPELFFSLADDLGGVGSEGYEQFKGLVSNTSAGDSFSKIFKDYENLKLGKSLSSDSIIEGIENNSGGIVDIDLKSRPPVSSMSLIGSDYSFDKKIDKKELDEITFGNNEELKYIEDKGFGVLNNFLGNLDDQNLSLDGFEDLYDYFDIEGNDKIDYTDLEDFKNAETPEEKKRIFKEKLEPKLKNIKEKIVEKRTGIFKQYEEEIKQLLIRQNDRKKQELDTLKFLHKTGFDLIPQSLTNRLIKEIQTNLFQVNGLNLNVKRLDLKNGLFGESPTEANGTKWKENLIKFLNKLIFGEINPDNSPLKVESFTSVMGASINPTEIQEIFKKQGIKSDFSWNINKMRENLKK